MGDMNGLLLEVDFCLQEAYKRAVREMAITDWSKVKNLEETRHRVAMLQVEIAKMIQKTIHKST